MNTKAIILICLMGYISTQAVGVCLYDKASSQFGTARLLQAMKKTCPKNKSSCCDATKLNKLKADWTVQHSELTKFFGAMTETIDYIGSLVMSDAKEGFRIANWKNNTVCKGKNTSPLSRRLQGVQPPCPQAAALAAALKKAETSHKNYANEAMQCLGEVAQVRAGAACSLCDRLPAAQVDQVNNRIFVDHKTVETMMHTKCGSYLDLLVNVSSIINKLARMLPTRLRRRLQSMDVDYVGFNITSCTKYYPKGLRRLQAVKDSVQAHKECADLGLWMMNGLIAEHGPWNLNPKAMLVLKKVTDAIGTPKAKAEFAKLTSKRSLQAVKPKRWTFAFNATMTGALL